MSNNPTSKKLTFRGLISEHKIEIPIIQRDYAQGREGKDELRKNFLDALHNAITKKHTLELDFVYGDVKNDTLQPLDGQQRLTTLFLLHWYIATKEELLDNSTKELLLKFTYETRTSSREFCIELVSTGINFKDLLKTDYYDKEKIRPKNNQLSKTIENTHWFFLSWKKDPTIKSMLTMLDAIHQTFEIENELWDKLKNISFHFIELKGFGLSDDLYIKMNARGKSLTDFENFKAKFEQYIKHNDWESGLKPIETFAHKIDTVWTDLFWNYRDKTENIFDEQLLNFFRTMAVINYTLKKNTVGRDEIFENNVRVLRSRDENARLIDLPISFNQYLELGCFDEGYFKTLKATLNKLSDKDGLKTFISETTYVNEQEIFNGTIKNDLSYPDLVIAFAYYQYLALEENIEIEKLKSWLRIVRNLVEGSRPYLFNNANEFANALRSINELLQHRNSIVNHFAETQINSLSGFISEQVIEEKLKAKLITQNDDWKNTIIEIENHKYFNGQIGFLLYWCQINDEPNLDSFKEYAGKSKAIFGYNGLNSFENFIFERALLAKGNYLLSKGKNRSFLIDNDRNISWKRLLRDNNEKREILKELLDKIISIETLNEDLQNCINKFDDKEDWRYYFIKQPEIIAVSGTDKLIRWNNENNILVLGSSTTSGYHRDYYCFSLYLEIKKIFANIDKDIDSSQLRQKSVNYQKSFTVKIDDIHYTISYTNGKYQIKDSNNSEQIFDDQSSILCFLKEQKNEIGTYIV